MMFENNHWVIDLLSQSVPSVSQFGMRVIYGPQDSSSSGKASGFIWAHEERQKQGTALERWELGG